ncbi:hypothetical protein E2C01_066969 [Portunus trituberculatus]|uniref:Uncharacterized protein n=1 Tax=Portunus trituberculatus TaxID=210409 RepID=A0A5B7HTT7_PORTR|nr:hypothetical protein [Portunus trituberculatus]
MNSDVSSETFIKERPGEVYRYMMLWEGKARAEREEPGGRVEVNKQISRGSVNISIRTVSTFPPLAARPTSAPRYASTGHPPSEPHFTPLAPTPPRQAVCSVGVPDRFTYARSQVLVGSNQDLAARGEWGAARRGCGDDDLLVLQ